PMMQEIVVPGVRKPKAQSAPVDPPPCPSTATNQMPEIVVTGYRKSKPALLADELPPSLYSRVPRRPLPEPIPGKEGCKSGYLNCLSYSNSHGFGLTGTRQCVTDLGTCFDYVDQTAADPKLGAIFVYWTHTDVIFINHGEARVIPGPNRP